jgi:hypothetical protein
MIKCLSHSLSLLNVLLLFKKNLSPNQTRNCTIAADYTDFMEHLDQTLKSRQYCK